MPFLFINADTCKVHSLSNNKLLYTGSLTVAKFHSGRGLLIMGEATHCVQADGIYGKSLCLLFNYVVNLNCSKNKVF